MKPAFAIGRFVLRVVSFTCLSQFVQGQSVGTVIKDGVILDKKKNEIYFLNENHQLEAIDAKTGSLVWQGDEGVKPVAFVDSKLLGTWEDSSLGNKVVFTMLDSRKKNRGLTRDSFYLPLQSAYVSADQPVKLNFSKPEIVNGDVYITWNYINPKPLQGIHRKSDTASAFLNGSSNLSGTIEIPRKSGRPQMMETVAAPAVSEERSVLLKPGEKITGVAGTQYFSSDTNNILISQQSAEDTSFNNYIWQIYDRMGNKIGQISDYRSYAPFVVNGSILIYEVGPYIKGEGTAVVEVPLQLNAVDLRSGKLLWSKQVFDNTNRKSMPP